ncbi:MAG: hypothetical protein H6Q13_2678 [Bacteroidetes bacterium]|nr:hypothetical protein [Bacteroidota bacterium]
MDTNDASENYYDIDSLEQIEKQIKSRQKLSLLESDIQEMIIKYINDKITPSALTDFGRSEIKNLINQFPVEQILDGVDDAYKKNVKFDSNGVTKESLCLFLEKIPSYVAVSGMPFIKQKILYIKGIARNRFNYWDNDKGTIILEDYVNALEKANWIEDQILNDLENEVIPFTKRAKCWSEWRNQIEGWTQDIKGWGKAFDKI